MSLFSRTFNCPCCGSQTRFPWPWVFGVEVVFPCGKCGKKLKTGYKTGAALFALGLTLALVTANLGVWLFSSFTLPFFVLLTLPLWIWYAFLLRRAHLLRKYRKK